MKPSDEGKNTTKLTFSLSRMQRILNPLDKLMYTIFGLAIYLILLYAIINIILFVPIEGKWSGLLFAIVGYFMWRYVFGVSIKSVAMSIFSNKYINIIDIDDCAIYFGIDQADWAVQHNRQAIITEGLIGTYIIRLDQGVLVIPRESIELAKLHELLGVGSQPEQR
ncbi:MAG: hypothetical protein WCI73_07150 [Phycisphaerae bacterium]